MNLLKTNSMRKFVVSVRQYDDERYITSKSLMLYDAVDADWLFNKIKEFVANLTVEKSIPTVDINTEDVIESPLPTDQETTESVFIKADGMYKEEQKAEGTNENSR